MAEYVAADGNSKAVIKTDRNLGDALVRSGILKPADHKSRPRPKPNTTWGVSEFRFDGRPYIYANCTTCKPQSQSYPQLIQASSNPEVDVFFAHCGITERPPAEILAEYNKARGVYTQPKQKHEREHAAVPTHF